MFKQIFKFDQIELWDMGFWIDVCMLWNFKDGGLMWVVVNLFGCLVGFVLVKGLVVINYYCVYGVIQVGSLVEYDYLCDGFYVLIYVDELKVEGSMVKVLEFFEDVIDEI